MLFRHERQAADVCRPVFESIGLCEPARETLAVLIRIYHWSHDQAIDIARSPETSIRPASKVFARPYIPLQAGC